MIAASGAIGFTLVWREYRRQAAQERRLAAALAAQSRRRTVWGYPPPKPAAPLLREARKPGEVRQ